MIKPGYTIVTDNPDSNGSLLPIRDDSGSTLTFDSPELAFEHYKNKYWGDTKFFYLVEFHEYTLKMVPEEESKQ